MTVPERSLKTSWLKISTGREPACSRPRTGFRSAQRISPLSIRPRFQASCEALFGERLFLCRVELGALLGQPGAGYSLEFLGDRGFNGLAPIPKALLRDQLIDPVHEIGFKGQGNFRLRHSLSMIKYHTIGGGLTRRCSGRASRARC